MNNLEIAKYYFKVSNESNFEKIAPLFIESSTYSSQNTGIYLGRDAIIAMQKNFHESFESLHWEINSISEEKTGIILIDFKLTGQKKTGENIEIEGLEYVVVVNSKIQHIEIRNK